jgi:hypothetical protein
VDEYLLHSLPNRTDAKGISLDGSDSYTGYLYTDLNLTKNNISDRLNGGIVTLIQQIQAASEGGSAKCFSAAELEYILVGTRSEIANQTVVFLQIYLLRMIFDILPVATNKEVEAMATAAAAAAGIGTAVVYLIEFLAQPFFETVAIVNGSTQPVYASTIYLTPSGICDGLQIFVNLSLTDVQKNQLKSAFAEIGNISIPSLSSSSITYNWGYTQYCFLLLMMNCSTDTALQRFVDIVHMEANAYYKYDDFQIKDAYTCVTGTVSGKYKSILPFDKTYLSDAGFGTVEKKRSRSY